MDQAKFIKDKRSKATLPGWDPTSQCKVLYYKLVCIRAMGFLYKNDKILMFSCWYYDS